MTTTATFSKKTAALIAAFLTIFAMLTLNPIAAHAAAGDITGTVTESVGSKPLGGVTVTAISASTPADTKTLTTTSNGAFSFTGANALPVHADYTITFTKTGYTTGTTTLVDNTAAVTADKALVTSSAAATVSGTIRTVNASGVTALANGATVVAYRGSVVTDTVTTTTAANGTYTLSLPVGTYTLGYSLAGTVGMFRGGASTLATGTTFTLAAAGTATEDAQLVLQGSIGGTVTDAAAAAINNVQVDVRKADGTLMTTVYANSSGVYSVANINPGTYYLQFSLSNTYEPKWYNNRASFGTATGVVVTAGNTTTGINISLATPGASTTIPTPNPIPTISGSPIEGQTLTANPGTWGASVEFDYQWRSGGALIQGAILPTYVPTAADFGAPLTVDVIARAIGYKSVLVTSAATANVTHAFVTTPTPTITGNPTVGETLTVTTGTWAPVQDTFTYQWYAGGTAIAGATSSSYVPVVANVGYQINVAVTAVKTAYPNTTRTSANTLAIGNAIAVSPYPTITGTAAVGKTLTAVTGAWTPSNVSFSYQWKRNSTAITGATGSTYTLVPADFGNYISVSVTAALATYTSITRDSSSTSAVLDKLTATPTPTITGLTTVGSVLTADPGVWTPAPVTLSYQWNRNNVAISGATSSTYTIVAADDLTNITVTVTATKYGYGDETKTSAAFAIGRQFINHNAPTITGNTWVGETLTATIGLWDSAAVLTHQWFRDGVAITGATGHTYKLTTADLGHVITVATTGTATGYITKTSTSAPTAAIAAGKPFTKAATPVITGSLKVGKTLGTSAGYWNPSPTKVYFQWLRNGVAVTGATKSTYLLTTKDKGASISVKVTVTRTGYATTSKTSKATTTVK